MNFLTEILATKRQRVAEAKNRLSFEDVRDEALRVRAGAEGHALARALRNDGRINLIAEFKRRSPSKGLIKAYADAEAIAEIYGKSGAAAISVLTEQDFFEGSLDDLRHIRKVTKLAILRKDFIFEAYQIYESAAAGADALLLITSALDDSTLAELRAIAEDELGMDALIEVHSKEELDRAVKCGAQIIGVNNRDLRSFAVSTETSFQLAGLAPANVILVSESGLNPQEVRRLHDAGFRGFLVGEALMRAADPAKAIREYLGESLPQVRIKICGITNKEDAFAAIAAGADMLGFNFYPQSPRFIEPAAAAEIVRAVRLRGEANQAVMMIGVFVNEPLENVLRIADDAKLNGIQLHGDETVTYCQELKSLSPQPFVIKAFDSKLAKKPEIINKYATDAVMIDAFDPNFRGGTGRLADWAVAKTLAAGMPRLILAGGLSSANVRAAVAAVQPYAVDACSSLEISPGRKSAKLMRQFVDAVRMSKLHTEGN